MVKVQTNVLVDQNLKLLAKARRISMSAVLNDALASVLAIPNDYERIAIEIRKLKSQLCTLERQGARLKKQKKLVEKAKTLNNFNDAVKELRSSWQRYMQGELKFGRWGRIIDNFCKKHKVSRDITLQYAEGRRPVVV